MTQRILIADDSFYMRDNIKNICTAAGYEVVGEAANGEEVVDLYKRLKPDIVTMDIIMPKKTGTEAVREIMDYDPNAKIIVCTAIDQESVLIEAIKLGAKNYIIKPIEPEQVISAIEKVVS